MYPFPDNKLYFTTIRAIVIIQQYIQEHIPSMS